MIRNYLITAFRNLRRNKLQSVINISGFAIGLAVSILIIFYVTHELTFDQFHPDKEQIYRLAFKKKRGQQISTDVNSLSVAGPEFTSRIPGIKKFTRLSEYHGGTLSHGEKAIRERKIRYADSSLFDVLGFQLSQGNPQTALAGPDKIVLTRATARKIFGDDDPMGKTINYNNKGLLEVSGIMNETPGRSHIKFSALISFETIYDNMFAGHFGWKGGWAYYTYLLLKQGQSAEKVTSKMYDVVYEKLGKDLEAIGWKLMPVLQPIEDIYLHYGAMDDPLSTGSLSNIYVFSAIAVFLLLIAGINFMNLSTAQAIKRVKEVGIRKVVGASRKKLIGQFLGESLMVAFLAFILALILMEIFLPRFNNLLGTDISIYSPQNWFILAGMPLLVLLVGIFSGGYPAFFLSSYKPHSVIKGVVSRGKQKLTLSNFLTITQFVISIALIIGSLVIYHQLDYVKNKQLEHQNKNLLAVHLSSEKTREKDQTLKKELLKQAGIKNVSLASHYPGMGSSGAGHIPEGQQDPQMFNVLYVDSDYISTVGMEVVRGRNFDPDRQTDRQACLINQTMAKRLNWEKPVGKSIHRNFDYQVIGVVKDHHYASLHEQIQPLIIKYEKPWRGEMALVKMQEGHLRQTLTSVQSTWKELFGKEPLQYEFVDDSFRQIYRMDLRFGQIILYFTILAILIACLGLFGLTAFFTAQRTREIGIRKAMGASASRINRYILKQFTRWVLLANLIAWPLGWLVMNRWLQDFAYRIDLHPVYFILGAVISLAIAVGTISYQSLRTAGINPAESLRYE
jgi:putative ABC transport system permease protein